jgi:hypothetical protein
LQDEAKQAADQAKTEGKAQFADYRDSAADQVDKVAESANAAADAMRNENDPAGLSNYVADIAGSLGKFADSLRGKSAEDLFHEANRLARENPALFIAGSVAVGFGLTRFMRASTSSTGLTSTSTSTGQSGQGYSGFDEEPQIDTDATFASGTRPFDDLDASSGRAPIATEAEQAELPTFNPASKADREEAKRTPDPLLSGSISKSTDGGLHS